MALYIDRSMNEELLLGSLEGSVRMLRPATANAEEAPAAARAAALNSLHYGFLGLAGGAGQPRLSELAWDRGLGYGPR